MARRRFVCRVLDPHSAIDAFRDHACTRERSSLGVSHDTRDLTGVGLAGCGDTKGEKTDEAGGRAYQRTPQCTTHHIWGCISTPRRCRGTYHERMIAWKEREKVGISSLHERISKIVGWRCCSRKRSD